MGKKKTQKVVVDITPGDIDMFMDVVDNDNSFSWVFPDQNGVNVEIEFVQTKWDDGNE